MATENDLWVKENSVPVTIDDKKHVMLVIDDITNMKSAEEGLRRYQLLSQHANDIIMFSNIDGRIIEANSAALMSYGYTLEEFLNKSIFELVKPDNRSLVRTLSHKKNAEGVYYEATARRKDGSVFTVK
jgi:PAS domain S-box-containing protein